MFYSLFIPLQSGSGIEINESERNIHILGDELINVEFEIDPI